MQKSTAAARHLAAQWLADAAGDPDNERAVALHTEFDALDPPSGEDAAHIGSDREVTVDAVLASDPVRSIAELLRRLDPVRSAGADVLIAIELADVDVTCTLHVHDGTGAVVLDSHRPTRQADLSASMSYYVWACLQVADIGIDEAVGCGLVDTDDPAAVIAFFEMFSPAEQT